LISERLPLKSQSSLHLGLLGAVAALVVVLSATSSVSCTNS